MDAQRFLAEFGHIANAPNGIARLRELILALAVQGRLVEQQFLYKPFSVYSGRRTAQLRGNGLTRRFHRVHPRQLSPFHRRGY